MSDQTDPVPTTPDEERVVDDPTTLDPTDEEDRKSGV